HHTATLLADGRVLVAGGYTATGVPTNAAQVFDPASNAFTAYYAVSARAGHTATRLADGSVLVAGGSTPDYRSAERFDPTTGTFSVVGQMVVGRVFHSATRLTDGRVLVVGGSAPTPGNSGAELFDPTTSTFTSTGSP